MRRAFTVIEVLIGGILLVVLVAVLVMFLVYGGRSTARTSAQYSLQQAGRVALAHFLREIQEGMEVIQPPPGSTLPHAVIRDAVSCPRFYYLVPQADEPGSFELWRFVNDPDIAADQRKERLLRGVRRCTFTARGEAALQVNLLMREAGEEFPLLTTVRLRNAAAADDGW